MSIEPIGPWQKWAKYIIEQLATLSKDLAALEDKINTMMEKTDCAKVHSDIKESMTTMRSTIGETSKQLAEVSNDLKNHKEKHEYKWKIIAGLSAILAIVSTILSIISKIK